MSETTKYIFFAVIFLLFYISLKIKPIYILLKNRTIYIISLLIILLIQLVSIFAIHFQVGDVMLFSDAGYYLRYGVDFYLIDSDHTQYPFFPFLIFFHAMANKLTYILPEINFVQILKLLLLVALYLIARVIYQNNTINLLERRRRVFAFLLNPVTYSVILFHGQIDVILIAFLIYATRVMQDAASLRKIVSSGFLFAASVATKTWSVIFLPLYLKFFGFKKTVIVGLVTLGFLFADIFIYTRIVFGSGFKVVLPAILKPGGPVGIWGLSYILKPWSDYLETHNLYIFGALLTIGLAIIYFQKFSFWKSACLLILWVYLIIPNWGIQYLFWILPFSYLIKRNWKWTAFDLLAGLYVFLNYLNIVSNDTVGSPLILGAGMTLWIYILVLEVNMLMGRKSKI